MKHIFIWIWHGEDVGKRLVLGLIAMGAVLTGADFVLPTDTEGWVQFGAALGVAFLVAAASKKNDGK